MNYLETFLIQRIPWVLKNEQNYFKIISTVVQTETVSIYFNSNTCPYMYLFLGVLLEIKIEIKNWN